MVLFINMVITLAILVMPCFVRYLDIIVCQFQLNIIINIQQSLHHPSSHAAHMFNMIALNLTKCRKHVYRDIMVKIKI